MNTLKQAMTKMLLDMGPQDIDTLILECRIHSSEEANRQAVSAAIEKMVRCGELYTNGAMFSVRAQDFEPSQFRHASAFLVDALDDLLKKM